jgi:hypothetical protein
VAQNGDRGATDAVVIAAVEATASASRRWCERANALTAPPPPTRPSGQSMRALAGDACEQLAALTGTSPSLVRFDETGQLDNTWVVVKGEIDDGFADEVIGKLRREKAVGLLINSPGGSLFEARRLGALPAPRTACGSASTASAPRPASMCWPAASSATSPAMPSSASIRARCPST